jgi:hypothetical protein
MANGLSWRGRRACQCVIDAVHEYEKVNKTTLRRSEIMQGSYSNAAASAGTHSGGGALDTVPLSRQRVRSARAIGFWPSNRTRSDGFSGDHAHWVLFGCPHATPQLRFQESELRAGRNALANRRSDREPRPARIRTFRQYMRDTYGTRKLIIGGKAYKPISSVSVFWINESRRFRTFSRHTYWLQVWLRKAGFYLAPLDGKFGPVTQAALDNYRRRRLGLTGKEATGTIGIFTLTKLSGEAMTALDVRKGR